MRNFLLGALFMAVFRGTILSALATGATSLYHDAKAELGRADPWMAIKEPPLEPTPYTTRCPPIPSAVGPEGRVLP